LAFRRDRSKVVRAAGGVVWRPAPGAGAAKLQVLIVHRPRYDDWSLPKGKMDSVDGTEEVTALREVAEETGLICRLGPELPSVAYRDRFGRPKTVRYWLMEPTQGELTVNHEVDEFRWLDVPGAIELLSYQRDRDLLANWDGQVTS
jgi:8-oxo-dGTP pyrophosphatase MutT (NUDIX family)